MKVKIDLLELPDRKCMFPSPKELPAWEEAFKMGTIPPITLDEYKLIDGLRRVMIAQVFGYGVIEAIDVSIPEAERKIREAHEAQIVLVKRLRDRTSLSLLKCKHALERANWHFDNAYTILRSENGPDFRMF